MKAAGLIVALLGAYALVDLIERDADERIAYRRWVADACIPTRAGESAIAISDGKRLHCTLYSGTSGYGKAPPAIISAAVMEVPL